MDRRQLLAGGAAAAFASSACTASAGTNTLTGTWTVSLPTPSETIVLQLRISDQGQVTLYNVTANLGPLRVGRRSLTPRDIDLQMPNGMTFKGALVGQDRLEGVLKQWPLETPVAFVRGAAAPALPPVPPAQPLNPERLEALRLLHKAPGMAAAARRRGGPLVTWRAGERALGSGVRIGEHDRWHLGSISKSFTATLVARLAEQGVVSFDDRVGDLLAKVAPRMRAAYRDATFRHLLSHRAGLARDPEGLTSLMIHDDDPLEERRKMARAGLGREPIAPLGKSFAYSNIGYVIVGAMLEARTGRAYDQLIAEQVFAPLGLKSAGLGAPGAGAPPFAEPYGHSEGKPVPPGIAADNRPGYSPAGRIHMSMADLITYLEAHRDGTPFLKPESWRLLHTPPYGGAYAMGWFVQPDGRLTHNGSNARWVAEVEFNPKTGIAAAAACNVITSSAITDVSRSAAAAV